MAISLLTAGSNGTSDAALMRDVGVDRVDSVYVWGTFDGATVTIQYSPDGTEWFDPEENSFTAKAASAIELNAYQVRAVVSGGGGSESINVMLM